MRRFVLPSDDNPRNPSAERCWERRENSLGAERVRLNRNTDRCRLLRELADRQIVECGYEIVGGCRTIFRLLVETCCDERHEIRWQACANLIKRATCIRCATSKP